ncbi:hypothetical protein OIU77_007145 [Salix suchowensis]|uniref:Uncharacterized protein n=1 Tax=Salix suchowensis TaxID=1278906 RepID=A0ABQ9CPT2_9ROSI|nr:hypothetical protein OIU77_007145 [Salix suchowensis]
MTQSPLMERRPPRWMALLARDDEVPRELIASKGVVDTTTLKGNKSHNKRQSAKPSVEPKHPLGDGIFWFQEGKAGKDPVASSWNPKEPFTTVNKEWRMLRG